MAKKQFEYGLVATAVYRGMMWVILITPLFGWKVFVAYVALMLFLGVGLRPLLELTGIYRTSEHLQVVAAEKASKKFMARHSKRIISKQRDEAFRKRRGRHPDLPEHW